MEWTKDVPSVAGHYWCKQYVERSAEIEYGVVLVKMIPDGIPVVFDEEEIGWVSAEESLRGAEWYGPVEPPK